MVSREREEEIKKFVPREYWRVAAIGTEGEARLFGLDIFALEWKETGRFANVEISDSCGKIRLPIYSVSDDGTEREFAARERSAGVWEFYLLETRA